MAAKKKASESVIDGIRVPEGAELVPVGKLVAFDRNPRVHPERQVNALADAMLKIGFWVPLVVDAAGNILAGHGRLLAAKKLNMKRVPVVRAGRLTESERRAFVVADNKIAGMAEWDSATLAGLLEEFLADPFAGTPGATPQLEAKPKRKDPAGAVPAAIRGY